MRISYLILSLLVFATVSAPAQDIQSSSGKMVVGPGDKGRALLAALRFSSALNVDSVGIAGCTIAKAVGAADFASVIQPAIGARVLQPMPEPGRPADCAVWNFQQDGRTRVYVEDFVQIRRESNSILPFPERLAFELRIQVLQGRGYREWHEVLVRPERFEPAPDGTHIVRSWRVIRYEVAGWEWMHEHSSSSGPVR